MNNTEPTDLLIVFARYPRPGQCKTRLIPELGPDGAAEIHKQMIQHTVRWATELPDTSNIATQIRFTGSTAEEMAAVVSSPKETLLPQGDGDLGARMQRAVEQAFRAGVQRVVVVGTDCPGITTALAEQAFNRLASHNVVLGPAVDGGYYLIGLNKPGVQLFHGVDWGTDRVLQQTFEIALRRNLIVSLLPALQDVDRPEDLSVWNHAGPSQTPTPRMSVVIPTLNDEPQLSAVVEAVSAAENIETVIVGAGQVRDSISMAVKYGAQFVTSPPGRACQMNAGACIATGRVLLFLHADTLVPVGFADLAEQLLNRRSIAAGAFRLAIDAAGWPFRLIEQGVWARSRLLHMPYGDQAIFLRRELFHEMGGFLDAPIMEDFEFVRRLRRRGRVYVLPTQVKTSARRWIERGALRTTMINQCVIAAYLLNVPSARIAKWYHRSPRSVVRDTVAAQPNDA